MKILKKSIPKLVDDWISRGQDESYDRKTLYKYIDGGAELYLTYDFKQVIVRRYTRSHDDEIILEIYDMGRPGDAFGIFSVEREDEDIGIGQGSEYGGGLLRFWKDSFFVSILATGDLKKAEPAMIKLAGKVDSIIDSEGTTPNLLRSLPQEGLQDRSVRFFHTVEILNRQYFLSEENILKLGRGTDCVLAKYERHNGSAILILIQYQNDDLAKNALNTFLAFYMPEAKESGVARMENNKWTLVEKNRNVLALVVDASQKDFGMNLLAKIE
jgi:hypothetical protein